MDTSQNLSTISAQNRVEQQLNEHKELVKRKSQLFDAGFD